MSVKRVGIIPGSTRPGANSAAFAEWILNLCLDRSSSYELVLLSAYNLPLLDEPGVPAVTEPTKEHSKIWQQKISSLDGFIFVTPQYNWGFPAALKNALDYLFKEWNGKPAMTITYGGHGGTKCQAQLQTVLQGLRMQHVPTAPTIAISRAHQAGGMTVADVRTAYHEKHASEVLTGLEQLEQLLSTPMPHSAGQ